MKRSNRLLILIGFVLAACAFVGVVLLANGGGGLGSATPAPTPTPEPKTTVVIAAVDIQLGDKITADKVKTKQVTISEKLSLGTDTFTTTDQVIGMSAGGSIAKDSVLHSGTDFLPPGTMVAGRSIAGGVAPDMVGVGIEVDQVNGVGTLIVGGDHVDVVLAIAQTQVKIEDVQTKNKHGLNIGNPDMVTSKLVIQNRKVLTTLLPEPETGTGVGAAAATVAPKKSGRTITNSGQHMIVILEVSPAEAEIIRYAQRHGEIDGGEYLALGLALRSDKDNDKGPITTTGITFSRLVQLYGVLPPDPRGILPSDLGSGIQW